MDQTNQLTGQEKHDLLVILEDAPSRKIASQARSYECNFCKRGFSNAQALGGHMNIHRKDKAKLKQHSLKESTTRRIPKTTTHPFLASPIVRTKQPQIVEASDSSGRYCCKRTNKYYSPWNKEISGSSSIGWGDTHVRQFQHMPNLLVDKLSSNQDHRQNPSNRVHDFNSDLGFSPSSHGLPTSELDLELRLGPEPLRGSVSSFPRGTIKFF